MTIRELALCVAIALAATPALAGAPLGPLDVKQAEAGALKFVCTENPAQTCLAVDGNGLHTGAECPMPLPVAPCEIEYVGGTIRGLVTTVADDANPDTHPDPGPFGTIGRMIMLELQVGGQHYTLAKVLEPGTNLGGWFQFDQAEEYTLDTIAMSGAFLLGPGAFGWKGDLGTELASIATTHYGTPSNVVVVIQEGSSAGAASGWQAPRKSTFIDESALGNGLGSIASYRVTIRFATAAP